MLNEHTIHERKLDTMKRLKLLTILLFSILIFSVPECSARSTMNEKALGSPQETAVCAQGSGVASKYPFTLDQGGIKGLGSERSIIVCISDIHLGADDEYAEIQKNRGPLTNFLRKLRLAPNVKELVIAGDLLDEWFVPVDRDTYRGKSQKEFVQSIAKNNKNVIDAFNDIIRDGKIKLTYVPGNHDLLITAENVQSIMPGISQARDVQGLGTYTPDNRPEIAIEHGHRYNFFCAPDPLSNSAIIPGAISPPGYFFTRIATTSVMEGMPKQGTSRPTIVPNSLGESQELTYIYWKTWNELMNELPIRQGFKEKIIKTNIDGFTETYAMSDLFPRQANVGAPIEMNLFKGILENWDERQVLNNVAVRIPVRKALIGASSAAETDEQANVQYFQNPDSDKRIVVFGHSHEPRIITSDTHDGLKAIYANSGTWIDKNRCPMTFVVIVPRRHERHVGLYRYATDGSITEMDSAELSGF